jgi:polysaccharide pyruvyl transferase WcaK-like protein
VTKAIFDARKLKAFASVKGLLKLKERVSYSYNQLMRSRDTFVINQLQVIIDALTKYISQLADYDLTQEDIDELINLTASYRAIVESPRQSITNRMRATKEIKRLFAELRIVVAERMDNLIDQFKESSPTFWQQYKSARKIIDLGHRRRINNENALAS